MFDFLNHPWDDILSGITAFLLAWNLWRTRTNQILRENNADLTNRVDILAEDVKELKIKVTQLSVENDGMHILIKDALVTYFEANPKQAVEMAKKK